MLEQIIVSKIDNKAYSWINGQFTRHLRAHGLTYQDYYETYITGCKEFCPFCGKPRKLRQSDHTYTATCCSKPCINRWVSSVRLAETPEQVEASAAKRKATTLARYGVQYVSQVDEVIQKCLETKSHIIDGKSGHRRSFEKGLATKELRYGDPFYNNMEAITETKSAHTHEQKELINNKRRETCRQRYGVENTFLLPSTGRQVALGNACIKPYHLPSGRVVGLHGVEHLALSILLKTYFEDEIVVHDAYEVTNLPILTYTNVNRRISKYYPDFFIPREKRIIEVKSQWWFDGNGAEKYMGRLENNMRKRQAAIGAGYQFEFWILRTSSTAFEVVR